MASKKTTPRMLCSPKMKGKTHSSKATGVINLVFGENAPFPPELSADEMYPRIIGVILANRYNLRKGKELFGERANEDVKAELLELGGLETYEPQRVEDPTYEDLKNERSNH